MSPSRYFFFVPLSDAATAVLRLYCKVLVAYTAPLHWECFQGGNVGSVEFSESWSTKADKKPQIF